ncbi:hypothetical protein DFH06DRAFT_615481 [Mycena polygramma]|nr:hypothetical protein DFH06DRAFT_615481 [Mycena polygramma]
MLEPPPALFPPRKGRLSSTSYLATSRHPGSSHRLPCPSSLPASCFPAYPLLCLLAPLHTPSGSHYVASQRGLCSLYGCIPTFRLSMPRPALPLGRVLHASSILLRASVTRTRLQLHVSEAHILSRGPTPLSLILALVPRGSELCIPTQSCRDSPYSQHTPRAPYSPPRAPPFVGVVLVCDSSSLLRGPDRLPPVRPAYSFPLRKTQLLRPSLGAR